MIDCEPGSNPVIISCLQTVSNKLSVLSIIVSIIVTIIVLARHYSQVSEVPGHVGVCGGGMGLKLNLDTDFIVIMRQQCVM